LILLTFIWKKNIKTKAASRWLTDIPWLQLLFSWWAASLLPTGWKIAPHQALILRSQQISNINLMTWAHLSHHSVRTTANAIRDLTKDSVCLAKMVLPGMSHIQKSVAQDLARTTRFSVQPPALHAKHARLARCLTTTVITVFSNVIHPRSRHLQNVAMEMITTVSKGLSISRMVRPASAHHTPEPRPR